MHYLNEICLISLCDIDEISINSMEFKFRLTSQIARHRIELKSMKLQTRVKFYMPFDINIKFEDCKNFSDSMSKSIKLIWSRKSSLHSRYYLRMMNVNCLYIDLIANDFIFRLSWDCSDKKPSGNNTKARHETERLKKALSFRMVKWYVLKCNDHK